MKKLFLLFSLSIIVFASYSQTKNIYNSMQPINIPSSSLHQVTNQQKEDVVLHHHNALRTTTGPVVYNDWFDYWNDNTSTTSTLYSFLTYPDSNILDNTSTTPYYVYCHGLGMSFDPTDKYFYHGYAMSGGGITDVAIGDTQTYSVDSFKFPYEYVHNITTSGTDSLIVEFFVTSLPTGSAYDSGTYLLKFNPLASYLSITPDSTPRFASVTYTRTASAFGVNECWDSIITQKQRYSFPLTASGVSTIYSTKYMKLFPSLVVPAGQKVVSFIHFKSADSFALGTNATAANYIILFAGSTAGATTWPQQPGHNSATGYPGSYQTGLLDQNQTRYQPGGYTFAGHSILIPATAFSSPIISVPQQAFHLNWTYNAPFPPIMGTTTICNGTTTTLSDTASGTGASWTSGTPSVATIDGTGTVHSVSAGTTIITYTNSAGSTTVLVTVLAVPTTPVITGGTTICTGRTLTLSSSETGGTWSTSNTFIATVGTSGVVSGNTPGTIFIGYHLTNMCGSASDSVSITVNLSPTVGTITGKDSVCPGHTITLSDVVTGGTWASTTTTVATVATTGVVTGVTGGSDVIMYIKSNTTCSDTARYTVYVHCPTGINSINRKEEKMNVYPNPNNGTFNISIASPVQQSVRVTITNLTGQIVKELTIETNKTSVLELDVPKGIYLLSATLRNSRYIDKIAIVK